MVEQAVLDDPLWSRTYGGRHRLIAHTETGRMLTVILAPKGEGIFYPVTAHPASRNERNRYAQLKGGEQAA